MLDLLKDAGLEIDVINLDTDADLLRAFKIWESRLGYNPNTIPQFWYQGKHIGGSTGIEKFLKERNVN
jgi:glutaredoxin